MKRMTFSGEVRLTRTILIGLFGALVLVLPFWAEGKQSIQDAYEVLRVDTATLTLYPAIQPHLGEGPAPTKPPYPNGFVVDPTDLDSTIAALLCLPGDWVSFERTLAVDTTKPIPIQRLRLKIIAGEHTYIVKHVIDQADGQYLLETTAGDKFSVLDMVHPREALRPGQEILVHFRMQELPDGSKQLFSITEPPAKTNTRPTVDSRGFAMG